MSQAFLSLLPRVALLGWVALSAACTTLVTPSRPAPVPAPPTTVPQPTPPPPAVGPPSVQPIPSASATPALPGAVIVPPRAQSDASSASAVLLEQSRAQRAAGSLPAAKASLERALRLDPNNPWIWLELGEIELQTGNTAQAVTMARKAQSLAGRDFALAARAQRLLRAAE